MQLSKRLRRVAANVLSGGVVADIGCDHGFTSIWLLQNGKAKKAIAMDINKGPLLRAKEHIHTYGMEKDIEVRLSDGMEKLAPYEADTLLISGMGGALICRILQQNKEVTVTAKELVLSPQSEIFLVRRCLHELGFIIAHEEMLCDQGKYYVIIRAVAGKEDELPEQYDTDEDYRYGYCLIEEKDTVFLEYLSKEEKRVMHILKGMEGKQLSDTAFVQKKQLQNELHCIQNVQQRMKM